MDRHTCLQHSSLTFDYYQKICIIIWKERKSRHVESSNSNKLFRPLLFYIALKRFHQLFTLLCDLFMQERTTLFLLILISIQNNSVAINFVKTFPHSPSFNSPFITSFIVLKHFYFLDKKELVENKKRNSNNSVIQTTR